MKKLFLMLLFVISTCQAETPVIMVLGDSLSAAYGIESDAGWVSLLQRRLSDRGYPHQVVNTSISGDTTSGGLSRLPRALEQFRPDILIIELGANDGLRGIATALTRRNITRMIALCRAADCQVLLLGMMLPPNFGKAFTEKFLQLYRDISGEARIPLVPFFLEGVADRPEWMQADGLHPNAQGQPRMLEHVWKGLVPLLETLVTSK
jgi:acyl-CoA thioesterase-1